MVIEIKKIEEEIINLLDEIIPIFWKDVKILEDIKKQKDEFDIYKSLKVNYFCGKENAFDNLNPRIELIARKYLIKNIDGNLFAQNINEKNDPWQKKMNNFYIINNTRLEDSKNSLILDNQYFAISIIWYYEHDNKYTHKWHNIFYEDFKFLINDFPMMKENLENLINNIK